MTRRVRLAAALSWSLAASGCAVGPNYVRPAAPVPAAYKELKGWTVSAPKDALPKGAWWLVFRDPLLDRLEPLVQVSNQTIKEDVALYEQSRALTAEARAQLYPTIIVTGTLNRTSTPLSTNATEEFQGSWAPDFWGRVRRTIASDVAASQASEADLQNATLSLQAQLATEYFDLRQADSLEALLQQTIAQYKRNLQITQNQYQAGTAPRSDVLTAQTQLLNAQAQAINVGVSRAQFEHAIAVLTGRPPAELTIPMGRLATRIPMVPVGLPSTLLERRPDISAAERRMKQENELIGVAIAGFFPNFSLSALGGVAGDPFSMAANAAHLVWSLGAAGSQTLFNGFLTQAQVKAARASYEESVAAYRLAVLTALQQVEDDLSSLRILAAQAGVQARAVQSARQSVTIALNEYRAGTQAYTTVVTADATALLDEETSLALRGQRMIDVVALIQAIGGGFDAASLPAD